MQQAQFFNRRIQLRKTILDGLSYYIVWKALNDEYERGWKQNTFKTDFSWRYRGFIAPCRKALLWSALMQLSKAYDQHQQNVNLYNILSEVLNNIDELAPHATRDDLENIQARITKNRELIDRLKRFRNRRLAHLDSSLTERMDFPSDQVDIMIEETKVILDQLTYACEGKHEDYSDMMEDVFQHTSEIIQMIEDSHTND